MEAFWKTLLEPDPQNDDEVINLTAISDEETNQEDAREQTAPTQQNTITIEEEILDTTLHQTIEKGDDEELKRLLSEDNYESSINVSDSSGRTPLHVAVEKNDLECLTILLDNKSTKVDHTGTPSKGTPTFLAAKLKHVECFNLLLKVGGKVIGPETIFEREGDAVRVREALTPPHAGELKTALENYGEKNDISEMINRWDKSGKTLVHLAVEGDDVKCLRLLTRNGADPDRPNVVGATPLLVSAYRGHKECLIELVRHEVDVNKSDIFGQTPAFAAALNGNKRSFEILARHGADIDKAAYLAAVGDHPVCFMFLMEKNADLSYVNGDGDTTADAFFSHVSEPATCMTDILNDKVDATESGNKITYKFDFQIFLTKKGKQMEAMSCLLHSMNADEEAEILNHPVCQLFLSAKMNTPVYRFLSIVSVVMWYIYFGFVFFYIGSLTAYFENNFINPGFLENIVIGLIIIRFIFGILQIRRIGKHNARWDKIRAVMHIISAILTIVLVVADNIYQKNANPEKKNEANGQDIAEWFLMLTDIVLVLHYIEYISIHMKFRLIGNYYVMFLSVLKRTIIALLSFSFLLFSFVIIFHRQFSYYNEFSDIFRSTMKTIVLMAGDLDYESTFNGNLTMNPNATSANVQNTENLLMPRIKFLIFIIFIHICLLNLMTGLAVENVTDAKKTGIAVSLRQQAEFLVQAEDLLIFLKDKCPVDVVKKWAKLLLDKAAINVTHELKKTRKPIVSRRIFESLSVIARKYKQKQKHPSGTQAGSSIYYSANG